MTRSTGPASGTAADLDRAALATIASRFRVFAAGCLLPMLVWTLALAYAAAENRAAAASTLVFQTAVLGLAWWRCRRDPARIVAIVFAGSLLLAVSATALFVAVGSTGEVLGFVLFTHCSMAALVFPWGWWRELGLTTSVLALFGLAFPWLHFALPPVELTPVIGIAAALCVAIAEGHARNFRATLRQRWSEEEALRALAASRDTYRDITENARDFIWATDLEGRITYVNEAGARMPAASRPPRSSAETSTSTSRGTRSPARPRRSAPAWLPAARAPPTVLEWRTVKGRIWVEMVAYTVHDASGNAIGFRGISRDVTERQLAETALRESEARYRGLVESQDALIYRADLNGNLTFLNEACRRAYGLEQHAPLAPLNFLAFVHPDDAPEARAALAHVAAGGRYRRVSRGRSPSGWRWVEWEVCAIADGDGVVTEVQGVGHDVTEQREADEALQRSLEALREREEQLRLMGVRQAAIREEERKRLGFDLHDGVCQELVGIGILIESACQRGVSPGGRRNAHACPDVSSCRRRASAPARARPPAVAALRPRPRRMPARARRRHGLRSACRCRSVSRPRSRGSARTSRSRSIGWRRRRSPTPSAMPTPAP